MNEENKEVSENRPSEQTVVNDNEPDENHASEEKTAENSESVNEKSADQESIRKDDEIKNDHTKTTSDQIKSDEIKKPKKKSSRKSLIILIAVIAVTAVVGSIAGIHYKKEQELKEYQENLNQIDQNMLTGAATAEKTAGMIHDVWYDTIFDNRFESDTKDYVYPAYGDFNKAISNYCSSKDYIVKSALIKVKVSSVEQLMKKLKNPPEEYEDAYDDLKDYYDDFIAFTDLALNPTGNLKTYTSDYNELDSAVAKDHKSFQIYLDAEDD